MGANEELLANALAGHCRLVRRSGPPGKATVIPAAAGATRPNVAPARAKVRSKAKVDPRYVAYGIRFRSLLEVRAAHHLEQLSVVGDVAEWRYEPVAFRLPGGRYTPDFLVRFRWTTKPYLWELKPSRRVQAITGRGRDTLRALRELAHMHPEYEVRLIREKGSCFVMDAAFS